METQLPTPAPMTSRLPQYRSERERQNIRSALRLVSVTLAARWALPLSRFSTCTAPISLHSQCAFIVYPVSNALDRLYFQFCPCVCVCVCVFTVCVERSRRQIFIDFHQILYAYQKCGRFEACCLWDKPEIAIKI